MAKGIEIPLIADVAQFVRGIDNAGDAVADLADVFDRVGDASDMQGAERALDGVQDAAGDAERAVRDVDGALGSVDAGGTRDARAGLDDVQDAAQRAERSVDDVDGALRGVDSGAADDVADGLRDVERGAERAADAVETIDDAGKDAAAAGDRVAKSWKDALDDLRSRSKRAGDDIGDNVKDGTDRAREGFREAGEEAGSTAREAAASFSGDPIDALDALQETMANALAGFGPLGAGAGLALAIGIGIGVAKLEEVAEQINAAKEEAAELAVEMAGTDDGERIAAQRDRFEELAASIRDAREWWEVWQEDAVTGIEQIAAAADENADVVAAFMASFDTADPVKRQRELEDAMATLEERLGSTKDTLAELTGVQSDAVAASVGQLLATGDLTDAENAQFDALKDRQKALEDLQPIIQEEIDKQTQANEVTRALAEAHGLSVAEYEAATAAADELTAAVDSYSGALEANADPTSVYQELLQQQQDKARETAQATADATADSSDSWEDYAGDVQVTTQQLIDDWNRQAEQARNFETNLGIIAAAGGEALANELAAKGPEVAGAVAEVIAKSDPATQQAAIDAHAGASGSAIADRIGSGILGNSWAVQAGVEGAIRSVPSPGVHTHWVVENPQSAVDEAARSVVPPTIWLNIGTRHVEVYQ